jgi:hypothetical protein
MLEQVLLLVESELEEAALVVSELEEAGLVVLAPEQAAESAELEAV